MPGYSLTIPVRLDREDMAAMQRVARQCGLGYLDPSTQRREMAQLLLYLLHRAAEDGKAFDHEVFRVAED